MKLSVTRLLAFPAIALAICTGCDTAYTGGTDLEEVRARYPSRVSGTCSSWLRSPKAGEWYCASPPFDAVDPSAGSVATAAPPPAAEPASGTLDKAELMARGEKVYRTVCVACHQPDGNGLPGAFPPLGGASDYYGDAQNMAKIIVHGLNGEITVKGVTFNGAMPAQGAALNDVQVAAVCTYVRNSFGNNDGLVSPEDVAAIR